MVVTVGLCSGRQPMPWDRASVPRRAGPAVVRPPRLWSQVMSNTMAVEAMRQSSEYELEDVVIEEGRARSSRPDVSRNRLPCDPEP